MFTVSIQSPFTATPDNYTDCTAQEAMDLYRPIDWTGLYRQIEATRSSPESSFYFYEIRKQDGLGQEEALCISGYFDDQVCVGYFRPKMEWKGFFKKKEVLNPAFQTQMDAMTQDFAYECLKAFIRGDNNYLELNMHDKEAPDSF